MFNRVLIEAAKDRCGIKEVNNNKKQTACSNGEIKPLLKNNA